MRTIYIRNKKIPVFNIVLLVAFIVLLVYVTMKYAPEITKLLSEPEKFRDLVQSYGYSGIFVFLFFQILQMVIAPIPGEVIQIAGGYIYGVWLGTLYLAIGAIVGTVVVFYGSRLIGYPLVKVFVSQDKLTRLNFLMKSQKADIVMFVLFLLPGLPKDILSYIAGLTPVKPLRFFTLTTVARFPALFVSVYIGTNLQTKNYLLVTVLSTIAVLLFSVGFFFKDRVVNKMHVLFDSHKLD
ncbi:TVP38/TMEM64 family protein [Desulfitobacterium sp.]|uniref:TVP38/TMEM64 family protein n=1 Tax=Desulfitobacterium sp. TaxID=49981 RepID=UPI002BC3A8A9|nr:TVP38/TMEM64 family protein [Desulfitobacterium sp.]HVJ49407.1 TVP38/TMEM64 family protein [Desulfitobacterium sp.]